MSEYNLDLCDVMECDPRLDVINAKILSKHYDLSLEKVLKDIKDQRAIVGLN